MKTVMRIVGWTVGMSAAAVLILDGKSVTGHAGIDAVLGAAVGLVLGCVFARRST